MISLISRNVCFVLSDPLALLLKLMGAKQGVGIGDSDSSIFFPMNCTVKTEEHRNAVYDFTCREKREDSVCALAKVVDTAPLACLPGGG